MINTPITEQVLNKLRPAVIKLLTEMNVQYAEYNNEDVKFHYKELEVTIKVKSKTRK